MHMPDRIDSARLDAGETIFFQRELEHVKARSYDVVYPELKGVNGMIIPISFDADPADETITYETYDQIGLAKIIANYADDLPAADVKGKETTSKIRGIGTSYRYNLMEIRKAAKTNKPLTQRKANAARRANDQVVDDIAWNGDTEYGLVGILNNPNITAGTVQVGGTTGNSVWVDPAPANEKNPDEILQDLNDIVTDMVELTNGVEVPDTILLPIAQYAKIQKTRLASGTDTTILQFFLANNPSITRIEWVQQLKDVAPLPSGGAGPADVMIAYRRSPDKLTLEIPQPYEQLPVQERNLAFVVNCHSRCGGVIIPYPLSVSVVEGI
jgi:hypothetical protein